MQLDPIPLICFNNCPIVCKILFGEFWGIIKNARKWNIYFLNVFLFSWKSFYCFMKSILPQSLPFPHVWWRFTVYKLFQILFKFRGLAESFIIKLHTRIFYILNRYCKDTQRVAVVWGAGTLSQGCRFHIWNLGFWISSPMS